MYKHYIVKYSPEYNGLTLTPHLQLCQVAVIQFIYSEVYKYNSIVKYANIM